MLRFPRNLDGTSWVMLHSVSAAILIFESDYIVQGHRFDIIEDYGCRPATYVSIPSILLLWVPPLILSLLSFVFACKPPPPSSPLPPIG